MSAEVRIRGTYSEPLVATEGLSEELSFQVTTDREVLERKSTGRLFLIRWVEVLKAQEPESVRNERTTLSRDLLIFRSHFTGLLFNKEFPSNPVPWFTTLFTTLHYLSSLIHKSTTARHLGSAHSPHSASRGFRSAGPHLSQMTAEALTVTLLSNHIFWLT